MMKVIEFLKGKKTYIVAGCSVVYAITGVITGHATPNEAMQMILGALGFAAVHSAVVSK